MQKGNNQQDPMIKAIVIIGLISALVGVLTQIKFWFMF